MTYVAEIDRVFIEVKYPSYLKWTIGYFADIWWPSSCYLCREFARSHVEFQFVRFIGKHSTHWVCSLYIEKVDPMLEASVGERLARNEPSWLAPLWGRKSPYPELMPGTHFYCWVTGRGRREAFKCVRPGTFCKENMCSNSYFSCLLCL